MKKKSKIRIKIEQKVNLVLKKMLKKLSKIVKNELNLCCKGGDPRNYGNSVFPAYVPEKNKIITPCRNISILRPLRMNCRTVRYKKLESY